MKSFDFSADAILRQRIFDLSGDITIDEAKSIRDQSYQDERDHAGRDNGSRNHCMATSKTSETSARRAGPWSGVLFIARWLGRAIVMVIHRHWAEAARLRSSASDFRSTANPKPSKFLRESPEKHSPDVRYQSSSRTLRVLPRPGYLKSS